MSEKRREAVVLTQVSKEYILGQIGGATLQEELKVRWALARGLEDPRQKIGDTRQAGQRFLALRDIDLTVYEGEKLGIIGRNGAGKSTLLKLLSEVTAPTAGEIDIYGRVASMLEVGTGFHREMTGRENVYLNGAILGMTRREIDKKMAAIIEFSEIGEFMDTPVKRYSSGMYVKLAFSVAAHLDSEIMIMDEVLAVGDMLFQRKCLDKMREASETGNRTILYVSHNMNTIRQLCDRCIVLDEGRLIFDGEPEEAIGLYMDRQKSEATSLDLAAIPRPARLKNERVRLLSASYPGRDGIEFRRDETMTVRLGWQLMADTPAVNLRVEVWTLDEVAGASYVLYDLPSGTGEEGEVVTYDIKLDLSEIAPGDYKMKYTLFFRDSYGNTRNTDTVTGLNFEVRPALDDEPLNWDRQHWGSVHLSGAEAVRV